MIKRYATIYLNIDEGEPYYLEKVILHSNKNVLVENLSELLAIKQSTLYSDTIIKNIERKIITDLTKKGYLYAKVKRKYIRDKDSIENSVVISLEVNTGEQFYIRSISFSGNDYTNSIVLRRSVEHLEGSFCDRQLIEKGKQSLERLGFLASVRYDIKHDNSNFVDIEYTVEEKLSGSIIFSLGYSGAGTSFNASLSQANFLGSGNFFALGTNLTKYNKQIYVSTFIPYLTYSGLGAGFDLYYNYNTPNRGIFDNDNSSSSNPLLGSSGGFVNNQFTIKNYLGHNLFDNQYLKYYLSLDFNKITVENPKNLPIMYYKYLLNGYEDEDGNLKYNNSLLQMIRLGVNWKYSNLIVIPSYEHGFSFDCDLSYNSLSSDRSFQKINFHLNYAETIFDKLFFRAKVNLGFMGKFIGNKSGIKDFEIIPMYELFLLGGPQGPNKLRGFAHRGVGVQAPLVGNNNSEVKHHIGVGGTSLFKGSLELFIPISNESLAKDFFRIGVFFDFGNVYFESVCDKLDTVKKGDADDWRLNVIGCSDGLFSNMRYSVGVSFNFVLPIGPFIIFLCLSN